MSLYPNLTRSYLTVSGEEERQYNQAYWKAEAWITLGLENYTDLQLQWLSAW